MSQATPVVFVVDDDISVREALESADPLCRLAAGDIRIGTGVSVSTARSRPKLPDSRR